MRLHNTIRVSKIEKNVARLGFSSRFHCITFELVSGECACSSFQVWINRVYHHQDLERVAYSILYAKLTGLANVAKGHARLRPQVSTSSNKPQAPAHRVRHRSSRPLAELDAPNDSEPKIARYILKGQEAIPCDDMTMWKVHMQRPWRWVGDTTLLDPGEYQVRICTVFLGLDVNFGVGKAVLFETTVLGGIFDRELYRYCTWQEAAIGHATIVERVKGPYDEMKDDPRTVEALALARQTVKLAGKASIRRLIEPAEQNDV